MAPSNKKKKKPESNPARGFATTSIASKPKPERATPTIESKDDSSTPLSKQSLDASGSASTPNNNSADATAASEPYAKPADPSRELHELSPDELERRLEDAELQAFVDKHAARTQRDAARCTARLQTDVRVLRAQAQRLGTSRWFPRRLVDRVVELATAEYESTATVAKGGLKEEDATVKLWALKRVLATLGFEDEDVRAALQFVLSKPPQGGEVGVGMVWGLEECLEWLVLNLDEEKLPVFDTGTGKPQRKRAVDDDSGNEENSGDQNRSKTTHLLAKAGGDSSVDNTPNEHSPVESADETEVSELDSDIDDPAALLNVWISTKTRLYEVDPELVETNRKPKKSQKPASHAPKNRGPSTRKALKLEQKMEKIESDPLFDKTDADQKWVLARNRIAQDVADRRRLDLDQTMANPKKPSENGETNIGEPEAQSEVDLVSKDVEPEDDDTTFGDLFNATSENTSGIDQSNGAITIRDFGNPKGVTPRRVLEEACRARDSQAKISYKLESQTAFSYRYSVTITWSKDQDVSFPHESAQVASTCRSRSFKFTMLYIATPEARQSESYISTFALFQVFSASPKEEKAHLRLPSVYRDLWFELQDQSKSESDAANRDAVEEVRALVRKQIAANEEEDVVLTQNWKKRHGDTGGSNTPDYGQEKATTNDESKQKRMKDVWTAKSSTGSYEQMLTGRQNLPMYHFKNEAIAAVEQNQVTIICGDTGCGKSTQMPQFILENELSQGRDCKIYCTEPRRISAITLAHRVSEELGEKKQDLGTVRSLVGYAIRLESHVTHSTRLVYATTGIVLRMLESPSEGFNEITHVVIDEVHERSIETDFLLIVLRSLIKTRPDLKVILMSATVDSRKFSAYFNGAPVLDVPGRTYPVETKFLEDAIETTGHVADQAQAPEVDNSFDEATSSDSASKSVGNLQGYSVKTKNTLVQYDEYGIDYELILKLIEKIAGDESYAQYRKAILVFLPGIAEIRRMNDMIAGTAIAQQYVIHSLHSSIASEDQQQVFTIPPKGKGKIVLSTNIAETGVTIPDITSVIDTGKHKEMRFDERRQISRLVQSFISRANAKQRRGRAGRVQEGLCFHLFTNARHDQLMNDQQTPEMLRLSLQDLIMRVKICNLGDIQSALAQALDPPSSKNIQRAIGNLIEVGALTSTEELTPLGQVLSKLPLDPYLAKLVLYGAIFNCLDTTLTLAAILTSKSPFVASATAPKATDHARMSFQKGDSDLLTEFNAYTAWRRVSQTPGSSSWQFCKKSMLSMQTLSSIEELKSQLLVALAETGIVPMNMAQRSAWGRIHNSGQRNQRFVSIPEPFEAHDSNFDLVTSVIGWSFYPKLLNREGKGWRNISTGQSISIHPSSVIRNLHLPKVTFLSYYNIFQSSGSKHYNANSLTAFNTFPIVLLCGEATFHPTAQVVSIDASKLRFSIQGGWKVFVALKILRKKLEEMVERKWKRPEKSLSDGGKTRQWWEICIEMIEGWKSVEE